MGISYVAFSQVQHLAYLLTKAAYPLDTHRVNCDSRFYKTWGQDQTGRVSGDFKSEERTSGQGPTGPKLMVLNVIAGFEKLLDTDSDSSFERLVTFFIISLEGAMGNETSSDIYIYI